MKQILFHICCAPCATSGIERLIADGWNVLLWFSNSNIDTREEFDRRLAAAQSLAAITGLPLEIDEYQHDAWQAVATPYADAPEGGMRCEQCFRRVLARAAQAMKKLHCDAFTTSLTVSPHKNSKLIFAIGGEFPGFEPIDFKKKDGFKRSIELAKTYRLYRQNYCGCEFSRRQEP